jgi:hypothetical protein
MFFLKLLKFTLLALFVIVVIDVGLYILSFYDIIFINTPHFFNSYFTEDIPRTIPTDLYNNIMELIPYKNIVDTPINGIDVTDEGYLNLLLTDSNIEITLVREDGKFVYAIRVDDVLYTVERDLFLFLLYIL